MQRDVSSVTKFIFTCEHGGNLIPAEFSNLFKAYRPLLKTHRAYDIGILDVFKLFSKQFNSPNYYSEISRLLIELNRSPNHKNLFSDITRFLDEQTKQYIIDAHYLPYRNSVEDTIQNWVKDKHNVIHISFHSFTPKLNGTTRNADIGLLYDPHSLNEKVFCKKWKDSILQKTFSFSE